MEIPIKHIVAYLKQMIFAVFAVIKPFWNLGKITYLNIL